MNREKFLDLRSEFLLAGSISAYIRKKGRCKETMALVAAFEKSLQREKNKKEAPSPEQARILANITNIAKTLPASGYSMGETKTLYLSKGRFSATIDCREYYARSCSYRPTHGEVSVVISPRDLIGVRVRGGLPTRIVGSYSKDIRKCEWIEWQTESYRGKVTSVSIKWVKGYLVRGWHTTSLQAAKEKLLACKESEKKAAAAMKGKEKEFKRILKTDICFEDSVKAGNCRPGTIAFCRSQGLRIDSLIKGKELLSLADKDSLFYIARIFAYKILGRTPKWTEAMDMKEYIKTKKEV